MIMPDVTGSNNDISFIFGFDSTSDHSLKKSHARTCDTNAMESCAMSAGFTGHLNNLDYSVCVEQQYGFCGIEFGAADANEVGSFSLTNETITKFDDDTITG